MGQHALSENGLETAGERERGGERRSVYVSGYKHNGNLCVHLVGPLLIEYKEREEEEEEHIDSSDTV